MGPCTNSCEARCLEVAIVSLLAPTPPTYAEGEGSGEAGEGQGSEEGSPAGEGGISRTQVGNCCLCSGNSTSL